METIVPFIPSEAERQQPIAQEYLKAAGHLMTANLQQHPNIRGESGSKWDKKEVNAVRAIPLVDLDPRRIVPEKYFPDNDNSDFKTFLQAIQEPTIDHLKEFNNEDFATNPFLQFFDRLSELCTTDLSEETIKRAHQSTHALTDFTGPILAWIKEYKYLPTPGPHRPFLKLFSAHNRFKWKMGGVTHVAINDGSVGVNFRGNHSGSDRRSEAPVINFECKPQDAGGIKRASGEPEDFISGVFAQEVAELIGSMITQRTKIRTNLSDQEMFIVSMHGTLFYISAAYFSPQYIEYIEKPQDVRLESHSISDNTFLWVRRSVHFDFKDREKRAEGLRFMWALISYVASGKAKINIVTAAIAVKQL